jgi:hypothetical protein
VIDTPPDREAELVAMLTALNDRLEVATQDEREPLHSARRALEGELAGMLCARTVLRQSDYDQAYGPKPAA